ncbi:hypothetical protein B5F74_05225 [Collinsella sp. An271]|uniref:hypothetical protein n=1 Tax=Collinsella sp. An271 TaxID=1965616 RepID=UPI000B36D2F4|nr:hypothetical protein [Collinsella sp. An271]OUO61529.1 hypothetical protein B5F74_05225 [Collinsella sp. An271]
MSTSDESKGAGQANLGSLNDILFAEMRQLMSMDMADEAAVERELDRAKAVSDLAGVTIDNANTVLKAVQVQDGLMNRRAMPKMLGA